MNDIMYYLNQHLDGVELEQGTSSSNFNEAPSDNVPQGDSSN